MSFMTNWNIERHKRILEPENHWELRRNFMLAHKNKFPEERLVCLSQVLCNIRFLGCKYPEKVTSLIEELQRESDKDGLVNETIDTVQTSSARKPAHEIQNEKYLSLMVKLKSSKVTGKHVILEESEIETFTKNQRRAIKKFMIRNRIPGVTIISTPTIKIKEESESVVTRKVDSVQENTNAVEETEELTAAEKKKLLVDVLTKRLKKKSKKSLMVQFRRGKVILPHLLEEQEKEGGAVAGASKLDKLTDAEKERLVSKILNKDEKNKLDNLTKTQGHVMRKQLGQQLSIVKSIDVLSADNISRAVQSIIDFNKTDTKERKAKIIAVFDKKTNPRQARISQADPILSQEKLHGCLNLLFPSTLAGPQSNSIPPSVLPSVNNVSRLGKPTHGKDNKICGNDEEGDESEDAAKEVVDRKSVNKQVKKEVNRKGGKQNTVGTRSTHVGGKKCRKKELNKFKFCLVEWFVRPFRKADTKTPDAFQVVKETADPTTIKPERPDEHKSGVNETDVKNPKIKIEQPDSNYEEIDANKASLDLIIGSPPVLLDERDVKVEKMVLDTESNANDESSSDEKSKGEETSEDETAGIEINGSNETTTDGMVVVNIDTNNYASSNKVTKTVEERNSNREICTSLTTEGKSGAITNDVTYFNKSSKVDIVMEIAADEIKVEKQLMDIESNEICFGKTSKDGGAYEAMEETTSSDERSNHGKLTEMEKSEQNVEINKKPESEKVAEISQLNVPNVTGINKHLNDLVTKTRIDVSANKKLTRGENRLKENFGLKFVKGSVYHENSEKFLCKIEEDNNNCGQEKASYSDESARMQKKHCQSIVTDFRQTKLLKTMLKGELDKLTNEQRDKQTRQMELLWDCVKTFYNETQAISPNLVYNQIDVILKMRHSKGPVGELAVLWLVGEHPIQTLCRTAVVFGKRPVKIESLPVVNDEWKTTVYFHDEKFNAFAWGKEKAASEFSACYNMLWKLQQNYWTIIVRDWNADSLDKEFSTESPKDSNHSINVGEQIQPRLKGKQKKAAMIETILRERFTNAGRNGEVAMTQNEVKRRFYGGKLGLVFGEDVPLSPNNVGARMLRMMGWEGGGLGKYKQGIEEPISISMHNTQNRRPGLGNPKNQVAMATAISNSIAAIPSLDRKRDVAVVSACKKKIEKYAETADQSTPDLHLDELIEEEIAELVGFAFELRLNCKVRYVKQRPNYQHLFVSFRLYEDPVACDVKPWFFAHVLLRAYKEKARYKIIPPKVPMVKIINDVD